MSNGFSRKFGGFCEYAGPACRAPLRRSTVASGMSPRSVVKVACFLALGLILAALSGCKPEIGDKCLLSTDCSQTGDRLCDTSQPDGYCTVFNCSTNSCPDEAACVAFRANVPGCSTNDRGVARSLRSFCVAACEGNSDCRSDYICDDPRTDPWFGVVMDDAQNRRVCLVAASGLAPAPAATEAPVCASAAPEVNGDAGAVDASVEAGDADADSSADAGDSG